MSDRLFSSLKGKKIYCVGIKGTGMSALAELLLQRGACVKGSDVEEEFYTDKVLMELGIPVLPGFKEENLDPDSDLVIYSAAYDRNTHKELIKAVSLGLPMMEYTEALGLVSSFADSSAIAGVHGKTTTTAMVATLMQAFSFPAGVLVGSSVSSLGNRATYSGGERFFIAETCEYRRHFLSFHPKRIVITSIEPDHLDYYKDYEDIKDAFIQFGSLLPDKGALIYCADDRGAVEAAEGIIKRNPSIREIPYGFSSQGPYGIYDVNKGEGRTSFRLRGSPREWEPLAVTVPGEHNVLNAAAAIALTEDIFTAARMPDGGSENYRIIREALMRFKGSKRRSEIIGEAKGILFMDDYGHHPTAIRKTIAGIKDFYPEKRLIVDFMSHTYTRTRALLEDFSEAFDKADQVILHKIYGSAREEDRGEGLDEKFFKSLRAKHPSHGVRYFKEVMDAKEFLRETLRAGDIFLTLGAGNNWILGETVLKEIAGENK